MKRGTFYYVLCYYDPGASVYYYADGRKLLNAHSILLYA